MNYITTIEDTTGMVESITHANVISKVTTDMYYHGVASWYRVKRERVGGYFVTGNVHNVINIDDLEDVPCLLQWYINQVLAGNWDGFTIYETEDTPDTYTIKLVDWYPNVVLAMSAASKETGSCIYDITNQCDILTQ